MSEIIKTAQDKDCDLIMMASHGRRGVRGLLLGSETHRVLTHTKLPVLVCGYRFTAGQERVGDDGASTDN